MNTNVSHKKSSDPRAVIFDAQKSNLSPEEQKAIEKLQDYGYLEVINDNGKKRLGPHRLSLTAAENGLLLTVASKGENASTTIVLPKSIFDKADFDGVIEYYQRQKTLLPHEKDPTSDPALVLDRFCKQCEEPIASAMKNAGILDKGSTALGLAALAYTTLEQTLSHAKLGSRTGRNR